MKGRASHLSIEGCRSGSCPRWSGIIGIARCSPPRELRTKQSFSAESTRSIHLVMADPLAVLCCTVQSSASLCRANLKGLSPLATSVAVSGAPPAVSLRPRKHPVTSQRVNRTLEYAPLPGLLQEIVRALHGCGRRSHPPFNHKKHTQGAAHHPPAVVPTAL